MNSVCSVIGALSDYEVQAMTMLNAKFASLRRLADLIYELGQLNFSLPDIELLIPVSLVTPALYINLQVSCPGLGLASVGAGVPAMQAQLATAYARLHLQFSTHPFNRLLKLQAQMDDFQAKLNAGAMLGADFLQCALALCGQGAPAGFVATVTAYNQSFGVNQGQVLTPQQRHAAGIVANNIVSIRNLTDIPVKPIPTVASYPKVPYVVMT